MKTALVTGARRGIGLATARALHAAGYTVLICATAPEFAAEGLLYQRCDITNEADIADLCARIEREFGRLDLLVNNAGVAPRVRRDILDISREDFDAVVNTNLRGTFFMCQTFARLMIDMQGRGLPDYTPRMINISSISAYTSSTSRGEYCVSKAGISMTTLLFADRLAVYGIPVFEVRPGIIRTDMTAGVADRYTAMIAAGLTPVPRMGEPEDVARCVAALASGLLDFATGQVINADGGFHIRRL